MSYRHNFLVMLGSQEPFLITFLTNYLGLLLKSRTHDGEMIAIRSLNVV